MDRTELSEVISPYLAAMDLDTCQTSNEGCTNPSLLRHSRAYRMPSLAILPMRPTSDCRSSERFRSYSVGKHSAVLHFLIWAKWWAAAFCSAMAKLR